jgi:hypothetical protein
MQIIKNLHSLTCFYGKLATDIVATKTALTSLIILLFWKVAQPAFQLIFSPRAGPPREE